MAAEQGNAAPLHGQASLRILPTRVDKKTCDIVLLTVSGQAYYVESLSEVALSVQFAKTEDQMLVLILYIS